MPQPPDHEIEVFNAALDLPVPERAAYLDRACAGDGALRQRVEELLKANEESCDFLAGSDAVPSAPGGTVRLSLVPAEKAGDRIGRYKLLQQIGEGGCGVVYMAEQEEPVRRRVALKVIKLGMDTKSVVARFEAERQALALMDHPNIAKVLDAGATETGRPYFVMELVRGIKITEYCDQINTVTRLELFVQVCQAIQHAHQKGIIHRDIKPSNILVADHDGVPVPKIIDFGIAKTITDQRLTDKTLFTAFEQFIGTPAYMSPEQANLSGLDVDTRSDIYSLGVLLYELLTGRTPFDAHELIKNGLEAIRLTIREVEPPRPSTRLSTLQGEALVVTARQHGTESWQLLKMIRGDLDWIVMKCLEKDRSRRYDTANGLAMDIRRHLGNEPIIARPPSAAYRLQKAWRRHKTALSVTTLIAFMLVAATGISVWQTILAKRRLAESEAISKFLTEVFQSPDPTRIGHTLTLSETLGAAAKKLETGLANQPARRAKLQATLGMTYHALGMDREAIPLQQEVRDYYLAIFGLANPDTLTAMHNLANSYDGAERRDDALKLREEVLGLRRKVLGLENPATVEAMENLMFSYLETGHQDQCSKLLEELQVVRRKGNDPKNSYTVNAMNKLLNSYVGAGRYPEALALLAKICQADPKDTESSLTLATWQAWLGQDPDYEATRRRLVIQAEGTDQATTAERAAKAACLRPSGDAGLMAKALDLAQRGMELGKDSMSLPFFQLAVGMAEYRNGQFLPAEQVLAIAEQKFGDHREISGTAEVLGTARLFRAISLFRQNRPEEARKLFNQAEAQMPPLPKDESKPLVDGAPADHDYLICWLAYKEAKALIGGTSAPAAEPPVRK
jgi:serine/threonine protein kinase